MIYGDVTEVMVWEKRDYVTTLELLYLINDLM